MELTAELCLEVVEDIGLPTIALCSHGVYGRLRVDAPLLRHLDAH
jgi:hypothetical protein